MTEEEKKEKAETCEAGCASGMQARFQKLSIKFKKLHDSVEKVEGVEKMRSRRSSQ